MPMSITSTTRKRFTFPRIRYRHLILLLIPISIFFHHPPSNLHSPYNPTLPIHQISLATPPAHITHTTNILSTITLPPSQVLSHVSTLPSHSIIFLTASCIQHPPNTRELLYLALLHTTAPAIVPHLSQPSHPQTLSHLLPIIFRAHALHNAKSLQHALSLLHPNVLELPSTTAVSQCHFFNQPFDRTAITNRSANKLIHTLYGTGHELLHRPPLPPIHFTPPVAHVKTVMFVSPWLQIGGSEQAIFHLATFFKAHGYRISFLVTQPFWGDINGRLVTKNDWMYRAYQLTPHVLDLVNIARYDQRATVFRYFLQSMKPSFIMTSNSRLFYHLLPMVRAVLHRLVIADYNHMVHIDWLGGGMPRYAANSTTYIDRHFAASDNVTNAIKGWVRADGFDEQKAKTCYIGADTHRFHVGVKKRYVRRMTREKMGISNDCTLILFAGRLVLDKGVDVLAEVIKALRSDTRYAFLVVGSGALQDMMVSLSAAGRVVVKPRATIDEMSDYYAAGDILLLPSVKEGVALVLYEAMANGLLVISTDVGGQKELVKAERGVLLQRGPTEEVTKRVLMTLEDVSRRPEHYSRIRTEGEAVVRKEFTTQRFCECVYAEMESAWKEGTVVVHKDDAEVANDVGKALKEDRVHSVWAWRVFPQKVNGVLRVGVVDGCGRKSETVESVKQRFGNVEIVSGAGFEDVLRGADKELMMIMPSGYVLNDKTDLQEMVNVVRRPQGKLVLDIMGIRVEGGGRVGKLKKDGAENVLCSVGKDVISRSGEAKGMLKSLDAANVVEVGIEVLKMNVLNEVFVIRTERLGEVSHMSREEIFMEAFRRSWNVGYVEEISVRCACGDDLCSSSNNLFHDDMVGRFGIRRVGDCDVTDISRY